MEGLVLGYRRSRHKQKTNHILIKIEGIDSKEKAQQLVGKKVVWVSPSGREIKGEIVAAHGNKGVVRAIFEKGLPGQAISTKVAILS